METGETIELEGKEFTVKDIIGKGSFAHIYLATSGDVQRAIKSLDEELKDDISVVEFFRRESLKQRDLKSDNIVEVYDIDFVELMLIL